MSETSKNYRIILKIILHYIIIGLYDYMIISFNILSSIYHIDDSINR